MKKKIKKRSLKNKIHPPKKRKTKIKFSKILLILAGAIPIVLIAFSSRKIIFSSDLKIEEINYQHDDVVPLKLRGIVLAKLIDGINTLPDEQSREYLIYALRDKKLPIEFGEFNGDIQFRNQIPQLFVNYLICLPGSMPKEIFWSVLVHENLHIENFFKGTAKVRQISSCQKDNIGRKCSFEYFYEEQRGLKRQLGFLVSIKSMHLAPMSIRELFLANDLKLSALAILRKNYIDSGYVHPYYAQYYDEFESLMLQDENLVLSVIQN